MSIVVQHEVSLKKNESHSIALVTDRGSNMKKKPQHKNFGGSKQFKRRENSSQGALVDLLHLMFKNWLEKKKKGKIVVVVDLNANMIETNIVDVHANSWWLNTGVTIHVTNSLQEMTKKRRPSKHEEFVYMGHISRQRLERLVRDGVLSDLDLSDFETCVVCLKGKMIVTTRNEKIDRCGDILDLIHTDICGPLTPTALGGYKYFITFIDDFSRYSYIELIHEKSDSLSVFKAFMAKVELQLGKPIKAMKSDRGGEHYGIYDETGRNPGPFAKFMLECGIDARYTMSSTPQHNGVAKRRNRTLLDMGCKAEVRPYNPQSKKLDPKTISGFFVGYCIGSRGSKFYCSSYTTRIIESDRVVYFEDEVNVDPNFVPREIPFGEEHVVIHFPTSHVPNVDVPIVQQSATNQGEHGDQVESDIPVDDTVVDGFL
ncbi:Retrovirus-related Pol polyprotein from transposon TNT 1-94 [Vitis vinifera]|uniref:Retrovirus-related Pol polyprotein from transposon TNT 1-94 n=1 Tax=Vitis vinifera TaxID=29760 RepID=A0A438IK73_VITVI|nr:Retrovirus-related Pol polyprotein from transposon TNT 1-94 [Vitis vinifera]